MEIYLDGSLLVKSKKYDNIDQVIQKRRNGRKGKGESLDWLINIWDSRERLSSKHDRLSMEDNLVVSSIFGKHNSLNKDKIFAEKGLTYPENFIYLTGGESFIEIPSFKVEQIVEVFENRGMDCVVAEGHPKCFEMKYASPNLIRIMNPSIVKKLEYSCFKWLTRNEESWDAFEIKL